MHILDTTIFLKYFIILIKHITIPHLNNKGASIGFNITCKLNQHSKYFESYISNKTIISSSNITQLLEISWNSLKHKILYWASKTLYLPKKKNYHYPFIPHNNTNLHPLYTIHITQFKNSTSNPQSILIEFLVTYNITQSSKHFKTTIPSTTSTPIHHDIQLAWNKIQNNIYQWTKKHTYHPSPLFNTIYIPTSPTSFI
jgi:hypothetical protein